MAPQVAKVLPYMAALDKMMGTPESKAPSVADAFQKPDPDRDALDESADLFKVIFKGEIVP